VGEPTFPVFGNIANGYNEDCWVTYSAKGFDSTGNTVCLTLNVDPINGWGQVYIAAFSSADFTVHMSWADNLTRITVYSQRTTRLIPSPSPLAHMPVIVNPTLNDHEGKIIIDNLSVTAGTLDKEYMSLHGEFGPGDPCWLVSGRISNGYDEKYYVAYHAEGYDSVGNNVSFTLDAGPILGVDQVSISGKGSENFTLHLSWADNVTSIVLGSQMWYKMFP
jgi:cell wall assembly regulator SMI1